MGTDELLQLLAGLRPNGIKPEEYKLVIELIVSAVMLEVTKSE